MSTLWTAIILLQFPLYAQPPAFEVATVKVVNPQMRITSGGDAGTFRTGGRVTLRYVTLSAAIQFAYDIPTGYQIIGPDWIRSSAFRFEIEGKAAPDTAREQLRVMLQNLLVERFHLKIRRERRKLAFYALVVPRKGPKMATPAKGSAAAQGIGAGRIFYNQRSMPELANLLSRQVDRPVLDRTGLKDRYDIRLEWTPESAQQSTPGQSLFTAIQEQLGLRLKAGKEPLDVIVVEHAEQAPAEN